MDDQFLTPSIFAKLVAGTGGFIGGALFMTFYRPRNVWDAALRSSVSTGAAIIGSVPLLKWLDVSIPPQNETEYIIATGILIGFCAWTILSVVGRFLLNLQDERTEIKLPEFFTRTEREPKKFYNLKDDDSK